MIKGSLTLQYFSAVFLLLVFLCGGIPPIVVTIFGVSPYLHKYPLLFRVAISFILWCLAIILYLSVSSSKQKHSVLSTLRYSVKDWVASILGVLLFSFTMGWLSGSTLGGLVKIMPNTHYSEFVEITNSKARGSKNKSVVLDLKPLKGKDMYYLALSNRQFNYQKFNIGDKLLLSGVENVFGIYVEGIKIQNKKSRDQPA